MILEHTTVICPKCGFAQEERLDCRKCGVVFSKYYSRKSKVKDTAPAPKNTASSSPTAEEPAAAPPSSIYSEENTVNEISSLKLDLKELTRRFKELEFERAERNHLRATISSLDRKVQEGLDDVASRLAELEIQIKQTAPVPRVTAADLGIPELRDRLETELADLRNKVEVVDLTPTLHRLERLEDRIETLPKEPSVKPDMKVLERVQQIEVRFSELERKVETRQGGSDRADQLMELGRVLKEMDSMRTSLQNVTVRYSEIGELKKNHLVLLNTLESAQRDLAAIKEDVSNRAFQKLVETEKEVLALRAEVRQVLTRLEVVEGTPAPSVEDLQSMGERLSALAEICAGEDQKIVELDREFAASRAEAREVLERVESQEERIVALSSQPSAEPVPPLEQDVHAIRQNLEEIRRFISALNRT